MFGLRVKSAMKDRIVLCGRGGEAELAETWAAERARAARRTLHAARACGRRVRHAYEEACHMLVSGAEERPALQISLDPKSLSPRIDLVPTR